MCDFYDILFVVGIHVSRLEMKLVTELLTFPPVYVFNDPWEPRRDALAAALPTTGSRATSPADLTLLCSLTSSTLLQVASC